MKLDALADDGLALSVLSLAELYEGVYHSTSPEDNERALNNFLAGVSILGIEEEICKIFGRERGRLRRQGKIVGDLDLLIAATCICHNITLLTNNRKHFEMIKGLKMVSV